MPTKPPGTDEAAFLAFALVDALVNTLIEKGVLTRSDANGMLRSIIEDLKADSRHLSKPTAKFLGKMIEE